MKQGESLTKTNTFFILLNQKVINVQQNKNRGHHFVGTKFVALQIKLI